PFVFIWKISAAALGGSGTEDMAAWGWKAVIAAALSLIVSILGLMCSHLAAFRVAVNMRVRLMRHIAGLPLGSAESLGTGKLRAIVTNCSAATENYLAHQLPDASATLASTAGLGALILFFDWRLGLLSLLPAFLASLSMRAMMGPDMQRQMGDYQNALKDMENEAVEYIRGIPVVKTFGQSVFSFERFRGAIERYEKWVVSYTKAMRPHMILFTALVQSAFLFLIGGGLWLARGGVTPGLLSDLVFYIIVTPAVAVNFNKIMYLVENRMTVADALRRVDGVLALKPLSQPEHGEHPHDASVTLENVSFGYAPGKKAVDGLSLHIETGMRAALVGPSGSGKSTLAQLIARFFDPQEGRVLIGGVDVRRIAKEELMNFVSFVFQDSRLIKASIFDNVRMGRPGASCEEVLAALEAAQCGDILAKLPQGADTELGAKGTHLSGGEMQRISIARAILKNAPILILDEATAFADPDNESLIQAALSRLSQDKTVIMIAHRLSSVKRADLVCVLENGKVVEQGAFERLAERGGLFARMWREQQSAAVWKMTKEARSC
ncbi:MAG: ABC transporter ATP-binding protein, partial [Pyramidobacter porci]|uniref:ABC transporter ATP-binding protein n=1 Tax=Pyramidobacter porci TaxID=2605789 RepID=UPI002A75F728